MSACSFCVFSYIYIHTILWWRFRPQGNVVGHIVYFSPSETACSGSGGSGRNSQHSLIDKIPTAHVTGDYDSGEARAKTSINRTSTPTGSFGSHPGVVTNGFQMTFP